MCTGSVGRRSLSPHNRSEVGVGRLPWARFEARHSSFGRCCACAHLSSIHDCMLARVEKKRGGGRTERFRNWICVSCGIKRNGLQIGVFTEMELLGLSCSARTNLRHRLGTAQHYHQTHSSKSLGILRVRNLIIAPGKQPLAARFARCDDHQTQYG